MIITDVPFCWLLNTEQGCAVLLTYDYVFRADLDGMGACHSTQLSLDLTGDVGSHVQTCSDDRSTDSARVRVSISCLWVSQSSPVSSRLVLYRHKTLAVVVVRLGGALGETCKWWFNCVWSRALGSFRGPIRSNVNCGGPKGFKTARCRQLAPELSFFDSWIQCPPCSPP